MKRRTIILSVVLLLLVVGSLIFYEVNLVLGKETYLFTDAPGEYTGKDTIDGEVFVIGKKDSFFER